MRVIAGEWKGRPLSAVPGKGTRPTTDKVKESIFNIIGPYFEGGLALDLYAGTGGLGLESLSRGMDRAIFVDADAKAVAIVKENVAKLRCDDRVEIYRNDAGRALKALAKRDLKLDVVFLDPPYAQQKIIAQMTMMQKLQLLAPGGWIVAEHDAAITLPEQAGACEQIKTAVYGDTAITIYRYFPTEE